MTLVRLVIHHRLIPSLREPLALFRQRVAKLEIVSPSSFNREVSEQSKRINRKIENSRVYDLIFLLTKSLQKSFDMHLLYVGNNFSACKYITHGNLEFTIFQQIYVLVYVFVQ